MESYHSKGKILLTGEYLVLKGALALVLPLSVGQKLTVDHGTENSCITWKTIYDNELIFDAKYNLPDLNISSASKMPMAETLQNYLKAVKKINPFKFESNNAFSMTSYIDFNMKWGLGSSSSLLSNLSYWADIDPYELNGLTSKGSGFDIAGARSSKPVLYKIKDEKPSVREKSFNPPFSDHIFFVYLNRKQNTNDEINLFNMLELVKTKDIILISNIAKNILEEQSIDNFQLLIKEHEHIISNILKRDKIGEVLFSKFKGSIKSLGAWGGDFIMAVSDKDPEYVNQYFINKGFNTIIPYNNIVYNN